tara:strand:+ start:640 stop:810 length:171 start_codon:yes stop_codon:yes gene_type:complete
MEKEVLYTDGLGGNIYEEDIRICADCGIETDIYVCHIFEDDYYCELCCPDEYGEGQ